MLCVLNVKDLSVVMNVMLSLMSVMGPHHALCNLSVRTVAKLCNLGGFSVRVMSYSSSDVLFRCHTPLITLSSDYVTLWLPRLYKTNM